MSNILVVVPGDQINEDEVELKLNYDGVRCVDADSLELMFSPDNLGCHGLLGIIKLDVESVCVSLSHDDTIALIAQLVRFGDLESKGIFVDEVKALLEAWKKSGGTSGQF